MPELDDTFGLGDTPFGKAHIRWTAHGTVVGLGFIDGRADDAVFSDAAGHRDDPSAQAMLLEIFRQPRAAGNLNVPPIACSGTDFQRRVWRALCEVTQPGETLSYARLAEHIGSPRAARAVGQALARNRVAFLIPCHRVICADGLPGHYRWGIERKIAILVWEQSLPTARCSSLNNLQ